jgi:hypothetical protein
MSNRLSSRRQEGRRHEKNAGCVPQLTLFTLTHSDDPLVDLIIHAWDHEAGPHTYVIITTDRDMAYALSRLRMKEYRIILLSPAMAHSDLTSQATIQLDWTKSILGLTGLPNTNPGDIPATTSRPPLLLQLDQPGSSRLRGEHSVAFTKNPVNLLCRILMNLLLDVNHHHPFCPNTTRITVLEMT